MTRTLLHAAVLLALLPAGTCGAQWLPVWTGVGQHAPPLPVGGMTPVNIRVAGDGAVFAGVNVSGQHSHTGVMRFDSDGQFDWLSEREGLPGNTVGIELLSSGNVALVGENFMGGTFVTFVRVIDGETGGLVWEREVAAGRLWFDERDDTRQIAESPNGDLMIRLANGGDFVVVRIAADGTVLPQWRWKSGLPETAKANDIAATADGGAVVAGTTGLGEGYRTVRFDADGTVVFADTELGQTGRPQNRPRLRVDAGGNAVVVASPETSSGVLGARVWKTDPAGKRLWTIEMFDPPFTTQAFENSSITIAPDGDVFIAILDAWDPRTLVIRLRGVDGRVVWEHVSDEPGITTIPRTLALAGNGRVLAGGYSPIAGSGGQVASYIMEFTADGRHCRSVAETTRGHTQAALWHADGWYVLGRQEDIGVYVRRYDASAPCDGDDLIFGDDFEIPGK